MPENLLQYEAQAKEAQLAFLKTPKGSSDQGQEAAKLIQDFALDTVSDVIVVDNWEGILQVVLFPSKGEKDWSKSVNARLIESGLAALRSSEDEEIPDEASKWFDIQEEARES